MADTPNFAALYRDRVLDRGWNPGGERAPVSVPHDAFVAAFKTWADAGGPCPDA